MYVRFGFKNTKSGCKALEHLRDSTRPQDYVAFCQVGMGWNPLEDLQNLKPFKGVEY